MLASASQVANTCGISRRAVYKAVESGRFASARIFGKSGPLRISTDARGRPLAAPPSPGKRVWTRLSVAAGALDVTPRVIATACRLRRIEGWRLRGGSHWRVLIDTGTGLPVSLDK